jgi:hypothetical protein
MSSIFALKPSVKREARKYLDAANAISVSNQGIKMSAGPYLGNIYDSKVNPNLLRP